MLHSDERTQRTVQWCSSALMETPIAYRVTWGKAPPFGDDLSLTYLFASTSEKSYMYVTSDMLCIFLLTEYHMRSDNMSAENRLLIAALKMSQNLPCGAKRPCTVMLPVDRLYDDGCHVSRPLLCLLHARSWLRMPNRLLHVLPQCRHM